MHPQTQRLFYPDEQLTHRDVEQYETLRSSFEAIDCTRIQLDLLKDHTDGRLDVVDLADNIIESEKEACKRYNEPLRRIYVTDSLYPMCLEWITQNIDIEGFAARMDMRQTELKELLTRHIQSQVQDQVDKRFAKENL